MKRFIAVLAICFLGMGCASVAKYLDYRDIYSNVIKPTFQSGCEDGDIPADLCERAAQLNLKAEALDKIIMGAYATHKDIKAGISDLKALITEQEKIINSLP